MTHRFVDARTRENVSGQRRSATLAEQALWRDLRGRRLSGLKFRRQTAVGPFIVDFLCPEARLIVELDGPVHATDEAQARDRRRDRWLREQGFTLLRFSNELFLGGSGEIVLRAIREAISKRLGDPSSDPASPGHLLPQGEKGQRERSC